jgi:hypothetical protein
MSKLICNCGHIIVDQTDNLPYKAYCFRDEDMDKYYERFDLVEEFINAIKKGEREAYIHKIFGEEYPTNLKDSSIIHDILWRLESIMYQCDNCGRVLIQKGDLNAYFSFLPEDEDAKDIFKGISK